MCGVPNAVPCVWVFEESRAALVLPSLACSPRYSTEGRAELRSPQGGDAGPVGEVGIQYDSGFSVRALLQSVGARSQNRPLVRKKMAQMAPTPEPVLLHNSCKVNPDT